MCIVGGIVGDSTEWSVNSSEVSVGGSWSPQHCVARQRVAVIIPFRERGQHLATLLPVLHAMLRRQQLQYTIYVIEQVSLSLSLSLCLRLFISIVATYLNQYRELLYWFCGGIVFAK